VIAVRGGYGLSRIVHRINWARALDQPRWIVGFSDITALHVEAARLGMASVHATMIGGLGKADDAARARWIARLENPLSSQSFTGLTVVSPGVARGQLFGGNLTLLHACAAAGRLVVPPRAVLFLEDINEEPFRVDRMLTTLMVGGHLRNVVAVLLGQFT